MESFYDDFEVPQKLKYSQKFKTETKEEVINLDPKANHFYLFACCLQAMIADMTKFYFLKSIMELYFLKIYLRQVT